MTIVTSLLEKTTCRLNKLLFIKVRREKKVYGIINFLSVCAFLGGASVIFTADEASSPALVLLSLMGVMTGFFSILINIEDFFKSCKQYKILMNNDTKLLQDEHYQQVLTKQEVQELFGMQLPDYVLKTLHSKIKHNWNLRYAELLEIHTMLERGEAHYQEKAIKDKETTKKAFDAFAEKYQLDSQNKETVQRIFDLDNTNVQHTKTFNSKKVL